MSFFASTKHARRLRGSGQRATGHSPWLQERLLGALRSAGFAPGCAQIQGSPDETRLAEDQLSGSRLTQFPGLFLKGLRSLAARAAA